MPQAVSTQAAPAAIGPYSQAVAAGDLLFVSGQLPLDPASGQLVSGDIAAQTRRALANIEAILAAAGLGLNHVVRCDVFLADMNDFAAFNQAYAEVFAGPLKPARQVIQAARLPKDARLEISCIASRQ